MLVDNSDIIQWINYERCTLTEYYPTLAIINLVSMLHDNALYPLYKDIVHAIMQIFKTLGQRSATHVNQVIPQMIRITEECRLEQRAFFISRLAQLASIVGQQILPYATTIFQFIYVSSTNDSRATNKADCRKRGNGRDRPNCAFKS